MPQLSDFPVTVGHVWAWRLVVDVPQTFYVVKVRSRTARGVLVQAIRLETGASTVIFFRQGMPGPWERIA